MPRMIHCYQPGCHTLIPADKQPPYCSDHEAGHEQVHSQASNRHYNLYERDQQANQFYHSKQWQTVRDHVVSRDGYASAITGRVLLDKDIIVDHIVPRRLLGKLSRLDSDNLWCLSRGEHNIKTHLEESMTDNQLKHVSKQWWTKVIQEKISH